MNDDRRHEARQRRRPERPAVLAVKDVSERVGGRDGRHPEEDEHDRSEAAQTGHETEDRREDPDASRIVRFLWPRHPDKDT